MLTDDQLGALVAMLWNFRCFLMVDESVKISKRGPRSLWKELKSAGYTINNEEVPSALPVRHTTEITDKGKEAILSENPVRVIRACVREKIYHILPDLIKELPCEYLPELLIFDEGDVTCRLLVQIFSYRRVKELQK